MVPYSGTVFVLRSNLLFDGMDTQMKRILALVVILVGISFGQQNNQNQEEMVTVTVPKSSLTPQQQLNYKQQEIHSWVGIGKEVGDAVNSSLAAVTQQSNNFAQTGVGKITVAVVVWKVMGKELTGVLCGIVFAIIAFPTWLWSYYRICVPKRTLIREETKEDKTKVRTYDLLPKGSDSIDGWRIGHWIVGFILVIITCCMVF